MTITEGNVKRFTLACSRRTAVRQVSGNVGSRFCVPEDRRALRRSATAGYPDRRIAAFQKNSAGVAL
ncbi:hypothetical protein NPN12_23730, partial [Vibrio parahaemolyticus]